MLRASLSTFLLFLIFFFCTLQPRAQTVQRASNREQALVDNASSGFAEIKNENKKALNDLVDQKVSRNPADTAWARLIEIIDNYQPIPDNDNDQTQEKQVAGIASYEIMHRKYQKGGIRFWYRYPDDPRRYECLQIMLGSTPKFWKDIKEGARSYIESSFYSAPIDIELKKQWDEEKEKMFAEVLENERIETGERLRLKSAELLSELMLSKNSTYRGSGVEFLKRVKSIYGEICNSYLTDGGFGYPKRYIEALFYGVDNYELSLDDLQEFVEPYVNHKDSVVRKWATQKMNLLNLRKRPLTFEGKTFHGKKDFKLEELRGKVVLVDIWNTGCSACIERMPMLKKTYDKLKGQGFIVVSASIDSFEDEERISKIEKKVGADWPLVIMGGETHADRKLSNVEYENLWERYGFQGVPQILLLDTEGKMVTFNGSLQTGDDHKIEAIVMKVLNESKLAVTNIK